MSRRLRSIGIFGVIALVALFALLPVAGAAPRGADTITVDIPAIEFKPKEVTVTVGEAAAPAAPAAGTPTGTVDAADQPVVEGSINVADVNAGQDGFIVAHLDEGGKPGKVIGHTAVKKGDNKDVKIKLEQEVKAGD